MTKDEKVRLILSTFTVLYPKKILMLKYKKDYEFVIAVILSAQSTDKHINKVTKDLFSKFTTLNEFAYCDLAELKNSLKSVNYFNTKAKHIKEMCMILVEKYNGVIPKSLKELIALPGIGRKTANVVLSELFNRQEGIAVDTHVMRLTKKWGLTKHADAYKVEKDLIHIIPKEYWGRFTNWCIQFGREYSPAKGKDCDLILRKLNDKTK